MNTMISYIHALSATMLVLSSNTAFGAGTWGYEGETGPARWGALAAEYRLCAEGRNQSPVDITGAIAAELPSLQFAYGPAGIRMQNNGHTVQVDYAPGHLLRVGERIYELKQFHFHAPGENRIDGRQYPMEAHLVHGDGEGNLAVVGVMFEAGPASPLLSQLWAQLPSAGREPVALEDAVSAQALLPAGRDYYRYNGSLTTPPCSEGVLWLVMKDALSASPAQIAHFEQLMGHPNNRPVQPAFARPVLAPR